MNSENVQIFNNKYNLDEETFEAISRMQTKTTLRNNLITPQNKINCLCFYLNERPGIFEKLYFYDFFDMDDVIKAIDMQASCLLGIPNHMMNDVDFQKKLIANLKPEWYDYLPLSISKLPEIQKKCGRTAKIYMKNGLDKDGYNRDWVNENGEIISFFKLKGNFPIKSKADYYKLYKEYVESKTSIEVFCLKYGIDSIKGFNEFLKRVEAESFEDFFTIKDVKSNVQKKFFISSLEMVKKLVNGDISFEEFFERPQINFNVTKVDMYFKLLSYSDKNKFACIIMDYFEKNPNLIKENFIKFLTVDKMKPVDSYNTFIRRNLQNPKDQAYIQIYRKQIAKLNAQGRTYKRNELYSTYIINGQEYKVDDNVIDEAYAYAVDNNYHRSYISMNFLCKQIATGKLTYSKETEQQKNEMIDCIIQLISEEKTIEDYIETIRGRGSKRK